MNHEALNYGALNGGALNYEAHNHGALNYAKGMEGHEVLAGALSSIFTSVKRSHPRTPQETLAPYSSSNRAVCVTSIMLRFLLISYSSQNSLSFLIHIM